MSLEDKYNVCETVYRFAHGVDTRDWNLYRSIFTDEVAVDYSSYAGFSPATVSRDEWIEGVRPTFNGLDATQHSMSNAVVQLEDDVAHCRMYLWAHHVFDAQDPLSWFTLGGYYDDRLVRSPDGPAGWLIDSVKLTVTWRTGDQKIMSQLSPRLSVTMGPWKHGRQSTCLVMPCLPTYSLTMTWSGNSGTSPRVTRRSPSLAAHTGSGPIRASGSIFLAL